MFGRRRLLHGFAALGAHAACSRPPARESVGRRVVGGVPVLELFVNGADDASPVVVAIHGRGDRPESWVETWRRFPGRVRVVLPRGFDALGDGFSWFEYRDGMTDDEFGAAVGAAEERLWRALDEIVSARRLLVTGFSQGAFLTFALASRRAPRVAAAFPVAGSCPGPLLPKPEKKAAPVLAFHGTEDTVVAIRWGRAAVSGFRERGSEASLREFPGVGHAMPSAVRDALFEALLKALPPAP